MQRPDKRAQKPTLLLKLLFTKQPLSIQVHPTDAFARAHGLPNGKSEAWYILAAAPGAKVALGLKRPVDRSQLRASIEDGSIADLVQWRGVVRGDFIDVPAGTIHAIGDGLVVAEIQQQSDVTFRLFDFGRGRELHIDEAVANAACGPAGAAANPSHLTDARCLLLASEHFVVERISLPPGSRWRLNAERETWMLLTEGDARIGLINTSAGEAVFLEDECCSVQVGAAGMTALITYPATKPLSTLLRRIDDDDRHPLKFARPLQRAGAPKVPA
jgi:mannose-6-phosphate isomerase